MSRGRRLLLALLGSAVVSSAAPAATLFDPALRFRVLTTNHFRIYFHQGENHLAARLATIAEETWATLRQGFGTTPPRLTHVVLADQTELANGYATPLPYDTIVIYAAWPRGEEFYTDDWLRLAFTHEFTHIIHLDRSEGWARVVRRLFGRTLVAFPNVLLPTWQIEGLATFEESTLTGQGRLHAGDFRAIVDEAVRGNAFEPLDRVNGGLTDWPDGLAQYAYGAGFHQYLANRFGPASLGQLAAATARRVPYTSSPVFRRIFGASLADLWRDFEASATAKAEPPAVDADISRLTHQGFVVRGPRFDRFACNQCPPEIVYASRTPHDFPSLNRLRLDGSSPTQVVRRYFGSTTGIGRDTFYFDQLEIRNNVGTYGDLFALSRTDGRSRRVTSGARLLDPDLSPDGATIACVQQRPGQRDLVLVRVKGEMVVEELLAQPDTQFSAPRWSPDGQRIVLERQVLGGQPEIIVVDVATRAIRLVGAQPHSRFVTPTWRPDGLAIVAAVSTEERPFNLFEFPVEEGHSARQLTHTSGGATWPEISPDGKTIVFVGYTSDGSDLFSMPYPSVRATTAARAERAPPSARAVRVQEMGAAASMAADEYSPWPTVRPTSWFPIVERDSAQTRIGAATAGRDVLGYHAYAASATWLASGPANPPPAGRVTPDWFVSYAYDRWRPTLFAAASNTTSFFAGPATDAGTPTAATRRERQIEAGVNMRFIHTRASHGGFVAIGRAVDDYLLSDRLVSPRERTKVRLAWQSATAHTYGYSISAEKGVVSGATLELVRRGLGSSGDATTVTGDVRVYLPGLAAHHVIAARLAGGRSTGDSTIGRTFLLGGSFSAAGVTSFGSSAISLLRGFASNSFAGSHVALINIDYRWPIARPQRGAGTWPFFLHTVHAAAFADVGHAWMRAFDAAAIKTSYGAELSGNVIFGYHFPLTVAAGAAWGHDGSGAIASRVTTYFRVGKAF